MVAKTVLISGLGIAGPTVAYWLKPAGFQPTIVEHAQAARTGGYVIDFWGLGYDIAERMALRDELDRVGYHIREMRIVNGSGERVAGFGTKVFRDLTGGRYVTLRRSALSRLLVERVKSSTEIIFGDEIRNMRDNGECVDVQFEREGNRRFDLVVGADGLHSRVRQLVFGPQSCFEKHLGYIVAAFEVVGYRPRDEDVYLMYNEPGRMLGRVSLREDRTLFLWVFTQEDDAFTPLRNLSDQKAMLGARFGNTGWECRRALDALNGVADLYFDRVSQIRMPQWSRGRVALVGDAAYCVSLVSGQGSALAMAGAYILAGEIARAHGRHEEAFANYEKLLRPLISAKQHAAERFAGAFAPRTRWGLILRNQVIRAANIRGVARRTFGRNIVDALRLPVYPALL